MKEKLEEYLGLIFKDDLKINIYMDDHKDTLVSKIALEVASDDIEEIFNEAEVFLSFNSNDKEDASHLSNYIVSYYYPIVEDSMMKEYFRVMKEVSLSEKDDIERFEEFCKVASEMNIVIKKSSPSKALFDEGGSDILELIKKRKLEKERQNLTDNNTDLDDKFFDDAIKEVDELIGQEEKESYEDLDYVTDSIELQTQLRKVVFGQDYAINAFVSGFFESEMKAKLFENINKPRAIFLFAGAPGSGKTFLAESMANVVGRPYLKLDMSTYSNENSNMDIVGTDPSYKNPSPGILTEFVKKNPKSVVLFDEIEKANLSVLHQIYQLLDSGKLLDNYYGKIINFNECILIFTSNVGRSLYENTDLDNLSHYTKKSILKAIGEDVNDKTKAPLFPQALISRFASGYVVLFNKHNVNNLLKIVNNEIGKIAKAEYEKSNIKINVDENIANVVIYSEGNTIDARAIQGRTNQFMYAELFELYKVLINKGNNIKNVNEINFKVAIPEKQEIKDLFVQASSPSVLVFSSDKKFKRLNDMISDINMVNANNINKAKVLLSNQDFDLILCDIKHQIKDNDSLNLDDIDSVGKEFFDYIVKYSSIPICILMDYKNEILEEEKYSFMSAGAMNFVFSIDDDVKSVLDDICSNIYKQKQSNKLVKENKVLAYNTLQTISKDGTKATIKVNNFRFEYAMDANESKDVLVDVSKPNVKLDDVIGAEDAKDEIKYFIEYLKNPKKYVHMGVKQPKGVLLYGPPGTGKTMLAKAMASESGVSFVKAEGNQFLKKFVGEGPQSIHEIFNRARKFSPAILFIDEIDAIATTRNNGDSSRTASVLTALLTEMDGFNKNNDKPVFVLAATNYSIDPNDKNSLDPALLRRFDKKIFIDVPKKEERRKFLERVSNGNDAINISNEEIESICVRSTGMSLADLENIMESSLRDAIKNKKCMVNDDILDNAFEEYCSGRESKPSETTLKRVAIHESGHALANILTGEIPAYLTIVSRGDHGGYMLHDIKEEFSILTKKELLNRIMISLAGKAAEEIYYGAIEGSSTGPSGDLENATRIAKHLICSYGMDKDFGLASIDIDKEKSNDVLKIVFNKTNDILNTEYENAKKLIIDNKDLMDKLINKLMRDNYLNKDEIIKLMQNK